jgi:hypothetical protein
MRLTVDIYWIFDELGMYTKMMRNKRLFSVYICKLKMKCPSTNMIIISYPTQAGLPDGIHTGPKYQFGYTYFGGP